MISHIQKFIYHIVFYIVNGMNDTIARFCLSELYESDICNEN